MCETKQGVVVEALIVLLLTLLRGLASLTIKKFDLLRAPILCKLLHTLSLLRAVFYFAENFLERVPERVLRAPYAMVFLYISSRNSDLTSLKVSSLMGGSIVPIDLRTCITLSIVMAMLLILLSRMLFASNF